MHHAANTEPATSGCERTYPASVFVADQATPANKNTRWRKHTAAAERRRKFKLSKILDPNLQPLAARQNQFRRCRDGPTVCSGRKLCRAGE